MKKTLLFTLVLMTFCMMSSCKKNYDNSIIFGDYKGMNVVPYESIEPIAPGHWEIPITFDHTEFVLHVDANYPTFLSPDTTYTSTLIQTHDNAEICGEIINQPIYRHRDTVVHYEDNLYKFHYYNIFTCEPISEDDPLDYTENQLVIFSKEANEQLNKDDEFFNTERITLLAMDKNWTEVDYIANDSVEYFHEIHDANCNMFPIGEEKYIGIKTTYNNVERLGWIKLFIHTDGKVDILETAIQK